LRKLLASIVATILRDRRDRESIATLSYSFGRTRALKIKVENLRLRGAGWRTAAAGLVGIT
jgi:hypothetical protein